jgi:hypothetical protein
MDGKLEETISNARAHALGPAAISKRIAKRPAVDVSLGFVISEHNCELPKKPRTYVRGWPELRSKKKSR